eukprot:GHVN01012018.1.p1 GENE.GHVN01012018.1~~GHVN01012018.1.p1  ORF type:complete len:310 (+),score=-4.57 GHVN01012018.1:2-931(+)
MRSRGAQVMALGRPPSIVERHFDPGCAIHYNEEKNGFYLACKLPRSCCTCDCVVPLCPKCPKCPNPFTAIANGVKQLDGACKKCCEKCKCPDCSCIKDICKNCKCPDCSCLKDLCENCKCPDCSCLKDLCKNCKCPDCSCLKDLCKNCKCPDCSCLSCSPDCTCLVDACRNCECPNLCDVCTCCELPDPFCTCLCHPWCSDRPICSTQTVCGSKNVFDRNLPLTAKTLPKHHQKLASLLKGFPMDSFSEQLSRTPSVTTYGADENTRFLLDRRRINFDALPPLPPQQKMKQSVAMQGAAKKRRMRSEDV